MSQAAEHAGPCPTCKQYKAPSLTVDAGVLHEIDGKMHVLLIERGREPFKVLVAVSGKTC